MDTNLPSAKYSAWNPGLDSQLPREYLALSTIFRAENVSTSAAKADELSDFCGLPAEELVAFRVERLIVHELLIHVTTGIAVPDGRDDEDLGRNFREIAATILNDYIAPHRHELIPIFEQLKAKASAIIERELAAAFIEPKIAVGNSQKGGWRQLFAVTQTRKPATQPLEKIPDRDRRIVSAWMRKSLETDDRLEAACFDALHRMATAVM